MRLLPDLIDPLPVPEDPGRPHDWPRRPEVIAGHLAALESVLGRVVNLTAPTRSGDGVLLVGGGKYWPGIALACKMVREFDPHLTIEVWHRGEHEPVRPADVAGLNVRIIDAQMMADSMGDARIIRGWEAKLYALTHTSLARVCYIDADAYPVASLRPLFDELGRREPLLYWRDLDQADSYVRWGDCWPAGPCGIGQIQGGQLMIDIARCWPLLALAHWMCQHSDYYFQTFFGDQDAYRVSAAALASRGHHYTGELGRADWHEVAFVCRHMGEPAIIHRCVGKLFRPRDFRVGGHESQYLSPRYSLPMEARVFTLLRDLMDSPDAATAFGEVYASGMWGGGSGGGSTAPEMAPAIDLIQSLIDVGGVKSLVDLGCGVGALATAVEVDRYVGVDVCGVYAGPRDDRRSVVSLDLDRDFDDLPSGDLAVCKDVIHHWPNDVVDRFLSRARESAKWKHLLVIADRWQQADDADCHLGGYRALDPLRMPLAKHSPRKVAEYLHKSAFLVPCGRAA